VRQPENPQSLTITSELSGRLRKRRPRASFRVRAMGVTRLKRGPAREGAGLTSPRRGIKWSQNSLPKYRREAESAPPG
jgi:hypothetical protein